MSNKRIIITQDDQEGAFHVDAMTGLVLTPSNEMPEWAEGLATAMLAERVGYYEQRLGQHVSAEFRHPDAINYADLSWVGIDAEGDEVEIEFSQAFRSEVLATHMGLDTSVEGWDTLLEAATASASVDYTYKTAPTDEKSLAEVENQSFEEVQRKAAEG